MLLRMAVLGLMLVGSVSAMAFAAETGEVDGTRAQLLSMLESDQERRGQLGEIRERLGVNSAEEKALWEVQNQIDADNLALLLQIIEREGWPRQSLVGEEASKAAFLILQHSDLDTQQRCLPQVREAAAGGELQASLLPLLEDRVLVRLGRKQIYGTQVNIDQVTGEKRLDPIENPAEVDARRASVGLGPLAEYAKHFGIEWPGN